MKIEVLLPAFLVNKENPTKISLGMHSESNSGEWEWIKVIEYPNGFPEIKEDEILYFYKENWGYILKTNPFYIKQYERWWAKYSNV